MAPTPGPAFTLSAVLGAMRHALGSLTKQDRISFGELMTETMRELACIGLPVEQSDNFRDAWVRLSDRHPLAFLLVEAHSQIATFGYIVSWPSTPNAPNPNWFRVTERGKQWVSSAAPAPEDDDKFLAVLNVLIPTLDPVVKQYIVEAVITYNRQAWFASAVMIGAASEKVVYILLEALRTVNGGKEGQAIENAIKERKLPSMFELINKLVGSHIRSGQLPFNVHEGCERHLLSLFESIRIQRNEAVHPTVGQVTPESVRLTLSAFPTACRKAYDLIDWCQRGAKTP